MTEAQELLFATELHETAKRMAFITNDNPEDRGAAATAILAQAFILSTPDLPPAGRMRIFMENQE